MFVFRVCVCIQLFKGFGREVDSNGLLKTYQSYMLSPDESPLLDSTK